MTDLSSLPDIVFVETDAALVEQEVFSAYETITGRTLSPGNPERLFCESMAYVISLLRSLMDQTAKQNLLAYASGDYLDHLGALLDVTRLEAGSAVCTMRFSVSEPLSWVVAVPEGTRVTPGSKVYFATTQTAEIPVGHLYVDVTAQALETGAAQNGYAVGQINKLVDQAPYIAAVENTDVTLGGSDLEGDDHYRSRIQLAPEKFSTAGPTQAYRYWAQTAGQDIIDVAVRSPEPGHVHVHPLLTGGIIPGDDHAILTEIAAVLSDRTRRPLTDQVTVAAPLKRDYDINLTYYLPQKRASLLSGYQAAIQKAVDEYVLWQRSTLGRDINPSELTARLITAGAKRVEITSPAFEVLQEYEVAIPGSTTVQYGGLEDE